MYYKSSVTEGRGYCRLESFCHRRYFAQRVRSFQVKDLNGRKQLKRKLYIKISFILVILTAVVFVLYQSKDLKNEKEEMSQSVSETQGEVIQELEEKNRGEEDQNDENISTEVEKALADEMKREKIELTNYADLPIEEFMEKTGIALQRNENNL